jgi:hypothetical protein
MNWAQFKKNVGIAVQLEPIACRLDKAGREMPEENDDWMVQAISPDGVVSLQNVRSRHIAELGGDHIYDFRSNPARSKGGRTHGFLVLKVQVFLQGDRLWLRPNARPGERVNPHHTPHTRPEPSEAILQLLAHLVTSAGWAGTRTQFNEHAARVLYGAEFGGLLSDPPDYFSALLVNGYVFITSLTDHGNRPDGMPDTTVTLIVTSRGQEALAKGESNPPLNTDARQAGSARSPRAG